MADPKDGESFFRKVVRFVANPATDWAEAATRPDEGQGLPALAQSAAIAGYGEHLQRRRLGVFGRDERA